MGRYIGPVGKVSRRLGLGITDKGARILARRPNPPGVHGATSNRKLSDFGVQLREKQKLRFTYGVFERQFQDYVKEAERRRGVSGENLLQLLEMRLDNVVYRMGLAASRAQARQMVGHRHFTVNGKRVNIPSYQVRVGDEVAVHEGSRSKGVVQEQLKAAQGRRQPRWLSFDANRLAGRVEYAPTRDDIDTDVQEQLIIEFYSR